ncbi:Ltp family lipoprotein [Pseudarthrobacter sp. WHRI 8279]|uniref:Ltp family lipoprotein n=1 Tax=Pseudarthrobacter sp. WHRI 8279 TaxID=3162566 RepID=UPI0032EF00A6
MTENTTEPSAPRDGKAQAAADKAYRKASRPWFKKKRFLLPLIIVGIMIISSIANAGKDEPSAVVAPSADASTAAPAAAAPTEAAPAAAAPTQAAPVEAAAPAVPTEYKSALKKAESYSKTMHMSKVGIYQQLTSEYGEKFSPEAAQYAVDNLVADYKANALEKAKSYQENMSMSPEGIRQQLTSEFGEKFTPEEADYAIQNLG